MKQGRNAAAATGLLVLTALTLGSVVRNDFITFDDHVYLTENPVVTDGLTARGLAWAFTSTRTGNWHPLTWISHMLDVQLFGMRPDAHHLVSLVLHMVTMLLLFALLRSLTGALWRPALVAALFAVHPLHVESVAWASERKDVLSILFTFLTALAYLGWVRRRGTGRSWRRCSTSRWRTTGRMCRWSAPTVPRKRLTSQLATRTGWALPTLRSPPPIGTKVSRRGRGT